MKTTRCLEFQLQITGTQQQTCKAQSDCWPGDSFSAAEKIGSASSSARSRPSSKRVHEVWSAISKLVDLILRLALYQMIELTSTSAPVFVAKKDMLKETASKEQEPFICNAYRVSWDESWCVFRAVNV